MEAMIGYVCVTKKGPNEEQQREALEEYAPRQVFADKITDANVLRSGFDAMCAELTPGDTVAVATVGVLGLDYDEILQRWSFLTKEKGVHMVVRDMPLLDTRLTDTTAQGVALPDLILQILAYAKRIDRADAKVRQAEGISAAKDRGVRFGRPPQKRPELFWSLKEQYDKKEISARSAAKQLNVTHKTFISWVELENSTAQDANKVALG